MKYYFPIHLDGGNRGCEAIAKSSAILLNEKADDVFGYCRDIELDVRLSVDRFLTLVPYTKSSCFFDFCLAVINKICQTKKTKEWRWLYPYRHLLQRITKDDIVIFTGGDMMCYDDNELIYINNWLHRKGITTILWGCSMGVENASAEKLKTLCNFSYIYARESLTYTYFQSLQLKHCCMLPDPAFILPAEECDLPAYFAEGNLIGLNISNFVMGGISLQHPFGQEVLRFITHIMEKTNFHIVLIPHVTWDYGDVHQDDRQMAQLISQHYEHSERLHVLDINNLNYCQIRYAISHCRVFIGARTHAVISAYSMCVPAIALGYSIKSRGIARDLGLDERLVINSKNFVKGDMISSFDYLMHHEDNIRQHLTKVMPEYKERPYQIRTYLKTLKDCKI
ncbi:MAG: polysaccharide pyruvyl transferase family protein [Prevotellaceae bacterium]|nr:polysaccharide pyruvyl transferase family protein [Prevotellaceae bacterium]